MDVKEREQEKVGESYMTRSNIILTLDKFDLGGQSKEYGMDLACRTDGGRRESTGLQYIGRKPRIQNGS